MTAKVDDCTITPSCGNVFLDLGFPLREALELTLHADLMCHLERFVEQKGWTREQVAETFGLTLQQADDLMGGQWKSLSLEGLLHMAERLEWSIRVEMDEPPAEAARAPRQRQDAPHHARRRRTKREAVAA